MIDHIKMESFGNYYPKLSGRKEFDKSVNFEKFGTMFYRQHNRFGKYIYHVGTLNNLMVKINPRSVSIENSLHKFYHGDNYSDYTYSQIKETVELIEEVFKISSQNFKIKSFEMGVNVEYSSQLFELCNLYIMDRFENMRKGKKVYGKKVFKTEYNSKIYDKYQETYLNANSSLFDSFGRRIELPKGTNRFEIEFKRMRPVSGIIETLNDLQNKSNLEKLGNKLIVYFDKIQMDKNYDYSLLTPRKQELFFAGSQSDFWKKTKMNPNTKKKKRSEWKRCLTIMDEAIKNDPKKEFRNLIYEKLNYLIAN